MRRYLQQSRRELVTGWVLAAFGTLVYLLTLDCSASWWDCGEFIATGYLLQVGHPPGAPVYQLLSHCFMLLSGGNPMLVAPMSNALSAIAGGLTVMFLYWTIRLLSPFTSGRASWAAVVGALCYLFCDTAWFSATESEVYSLAMLFCAVTAWLMLRWERKGDDRRLLLIALLVGLGAGVHLMTLLTLPVLLLIFIRNKAWRRKGLLKLLSTCLFFFLLGITPYAIIPIRAAANPPINEGNPSTVENFERYIRREQYTKAPLYPRMWREKDTANYEDWNFSFDGVVGNAVYCFNYQLGYMYFRYLMYNYIGRMNLKWSIIVVFVFPVLIGLWGLLQHRRRKRSNYWIVMLLFLFGGIVLNFYLNHPCYEPRERDYVYVLSFYAFAIWIGIGAESLAESGRIKQWLLVILFALAPLSEALGNWSDHDRHRSHIVHDISLNHLQSCDHGAMLFSLGDNDTFPLWYLQQVEGRRTDIELHNINMTGVHASIYLMKENIDQRPVYLTHYAYRRFGKIFEGHLRCEGFCWRLLPTTEGADDIIPLQRHIADSIQWNITENEYIDFVSEDMLKIWAENTAILQ